MYISRSPLRISLGGGGTDLPSWYSKYESFFISAAINKYIFITVSNRSFDKKFWLSYSDVEISDDLNSIRHDILKEVLEYFKKSSNNFNDGIEIHTISEVPGRSGLGSSGALSSGLFYILSNFFHVDLSKKNIADLACDLEINILNSGSGKQDQFISTLGGLRFLKLIKLET